MGPRLVPDTKTVADFDTKDFLQYYSISIFLK
jgi:hypothetical protein